MTWSEPEALMIKSLLKSVEATDKNVNEIKEAIVGSLANGGKAGLQDRVRELDSSIDRLHGDFIAHKNVDGKAHKFMKRTILSVGLFTLIALLLNFGAVVKLIELVIKWIK